METRKIGVREFRDKLATYLTELDQPLTITRHGDTIGYFIPVPRKRTEAERGAFREALTHWNEMLASKGIDEDEVVAEFKRERKAARS